LAAGIAASGLTPKQSSGVDTKGKIHFTQGQIAVPGSGFNELNAPYDAKVVGDYTGLTAP